MRSLRVLIDIDGIVADTLPHWLEYLGQKTGVTAKVEDINLYDLSKCPPLDQLGPKTIFGVLQDPGFTLAIKPMEGAAEALQKLMADGHEVYLVTARSGAQHIAETYEWVKRELPFIDTRKQLVFIYDKHIIPADVLIDDQAATLSKYGECWPGAFLLGIRYLYNEDHPYDKNLNVFLVENNKYSWPTIQRAITLHAEKP